jgi:hypothetical protein
MRSDENNRMREFNKAQHRVEVTGLRTGRLTFELARHICTFFFLHPPQRTKDDV